MGYEAVETEHSWKKKACYKRAGGGHTPDGVFGLLGAIWQLRRLGTIYSRRANDRPDFRRRKSKGLMVLAVNLTA